jgi:hypothetical protein
MIPLIFVCSVFLFQYVSVSGAIWWVVLEGAFLDLLGIGAIPIETVAYSISAICIFLASRHLFSNHSYYGLAATTILGLITVAIVEMVIAIFFVMFFSNVLDSIGIFTVRLFGAMLSLPILLLLFPLANPTRRLIQLLLPI